MPKPDKPDQPLALRSLVAMDPSVSVIPTARPPEPEAVPSATPAAEGALTATVRYFPLGNAYECFACSDPQAKVHTIRVTRTMEGGTVVTPMCENCAGQEVDGVLERGDLIVSADGTHLVAPMLDEIQKKAAEYQAEADATADEVPSE
jgi:hypothetical protein